MSGSSHRTHGSSASYADISARHATDNHFIKVTSGYQLGRDGADPNIIISISLANGTIDLLPDPNILLRLPPVTRRNLKTESFTTRRTGGFTSLTASLSCATLAVVIVGVGLDASLQLSFSELRRAAQEAERLGFESLWTPGSGVPDPFHVCAAWAEDTSLRTGISVVPAARMWTPVALAIQAATLGQLSSGRFVLGLGTGGYGQKFWESLGLPNRPIAVMRDYVTTVRQLLSGDTVTYDGPAIRLDGVSIGVHDLPPIPIYLAAIGPQMLKLSGECADGTLLNWATPTRIAESRALIAEGAQRVGRDPSAHVISMYIHVCIDSDALRARRALGVQVLRYAMGHDDDPAVARNRGQLYRGLFAQMGFEDVLSELEDRRDRGASTGELIDAAPDELFQAVGYFGTAAEAPSAYARLSAGLDEAVVRIVTVRRGLEPVIEAMEALTPTRVNAAV